MMGKLGDGSGQLSNANGSHMIDQNTFTKRLQALYFHWNKYNDEMWGSADFYTVATPPPTDVGQLAHIKSSTFTNWLLGYEFPDTIMVFGSKQIHFLCSQKNASLLESVKGSAKEAVDVAVVIHTEVKDDDGTSKIDAVLHSIRVSKLETDDAPIIGYIMEDSPEGSLLAKWADKLNTSGLQLHDVTNGVSDLFALKDLNELVGPVLNKFEPICLPDLHMYPSFSQKISTGTLEAHANGFRYSTLGQDDERLDIMLANIKHAFFQPAEAQYPLLHFHLHDHMMVGDKKTKDLQFYIEWQTWINYKMEERTGPIKRKNMDFQYFVNRVHEEVGLEFEQPRFEQGFHGEPSDRRLSDFIVPTKSCLVELKSLPFLVITLSEIAIVNLERIRRIVRGKEKQESQSEFDMAIVFKDMKRDVMLIYSIQPTSLEGIEVWLKISAGIKFHKSSVNLKWRAILDAFISDPKVFEKEGGWNFLNIQDDCDSDYDDSQVFESSSSSSSRSDFMPACGYERLVQSDTRNTGGKNRTRAVQESEGRPGCRIMIVSGGFVEFCKACTTNFFCR